MTWFVCICLLEEVAERKATCIPHKRTIKDNVGITPVIRTAIAISTR